jgi:hypothetical protein
MLRVLHLSTRFGYHLVKGLVTAADPGESLDEFLGTSGGILSKVAQMRGMRGLESTEVFDDHTPYNRAELDARFEDFCAEHGLVDPSELLHSGSVGGVYRAVLPGGEVVAVKVRYPGIDALFRSDAVFAGGLVSHTAPELADQAVASTLLELDYREEQALLDHMGSIWRPSVRIPTIHAQLCTDDVTVMSFVDSEPLLPYIERVSGSGKAAIAKQLYWFLMASWARDGLVYADPHWGNLYVGADGVLEVVDFGSVGRVQPASFHKFVHRVVLPVGETDSEFYHTMRAVCIGEHFTGDDHQMKKLESLVFGADSGEAVVGGEWQCFRMLYMFAWVLHKMSIHVDFTETTREVVALFYKTHDTVRVDDDIQEYVQRTVTA